MNAALLSPRCIVPAESLSKDGKGLHRCLVMSTGQSELDSITV